MEFSKILKPELKNVFMKDKKIIAVLLFGSYTKSKHYRDIDICVVLDKKYPNLVMSKKRLKYTSLFPSKFDIRIFQQLPLYIRKRILKDGKIILSNNEELLYDIAFSTIKEFEMYKKAYYGYLESMQNGK